jgi:hypothetical protein
VSKEMLEVALLSTVTNWHVGGVSTVTNWRVGGDIIQSVMRNEHFLSNFFLAGGTKGSSLKIEFYGSRMTSREAILESLIFGLETVFLGYPVWISRHPKK